MPESTETLSDVEAWHDQRSPDWRLFETDNRRYLFVVNASQVYEISSDVAARLAELDSGSPCAVAEVWNELGLPLQPQIDNEAPREMPLRAISLAIAQKCNLGCNYCYAQEGSFGGEAKAMSREVALAAVDRLFAETPPGERVNLSFLGGEPLLNRPVLRDATRYAATLSRARGVNVGFSITTNGTLLTPDDGEFFEAHGFAVTISLDGVGAAHDQQRGFKDGRGSFGSILKNIQPLLARQRAMQVSARVTITPQNLALRETLDAFIALRFHSVGFSPMLASPTARGEMQAVDLALMLEQMIACGEAFEHAVLSGRRYPFSNMVTALRELHRGTHRPYPCGAGAGYMGVSADGSLSACHRFVGEPAAAMGSVDRGVDRSRQARWLDERHVHHQEPCNSCWARYLCGGGCHHEVIHRGRPACDYIKGWLGYCLKAYVRLLALRPDYFGQPAKTLECATLAADG